MKRLQGYYWVLMHPFYTGSPEPVWLVCLYREFNGIGNWLLPGLNQPLRDEHFKTITEKPLATPVGGEGYIIWTPEQK